LIGRKTIKRFTSIRLPAAPQFRDQPQDVGKQISSFRVVSDQSSHGEVQVKG
jgi:hypothetical protein